MMEYVLLIWIGEFLYFENINFIRKRNLNSDNYEQLDFPYFNEYKDWLIFLDHFEEYIKDNIESIKFYKTKNKNNYLILDLCDYSEIAFIKRKT